MTRPAPQPGTATSRPYRVEAPRASDAIGLALRDAFDEGFGLPDEMTALLRRLNGASTRGAR